MVFWFWAQNDFLYCPSLPRKIKLHSKKVKIDLKTIISLLRSKCATHSLTVEIAGQPVVNFINVFCPYFTYESSFKAKFQAEERCSYEKCPSKMLMKLTPWQNPLCWQQHSSSSNQTRDVRQVWACQSNWSTFPRRSTPYRWRLTSPTSSPRRWWTLRCRDVGDSNIPKRAEILEFTI